MTDVYWLVQTPCQLERARQGNVAFLSEVIASRLSIRGWIWRSLFRVPDADWVLTAQEVSHVLPRRSNHLDWEVCDAGSA
jgi:hypothetical protein